MPQRNRHSKAEVEKDVWSSPANAGNHAKQIGRKVDRCPHEKED